MAWDIVTWSLTILNMASQLDVEVEPEILDVRNFE